METDPLVAFVNGELLPYLKGLAGSPRADRVARLFDSVATVMKSGHALREVIDKVDQIDFHAVTDAHTLSVIYETLLSRTSDAGWSGEFYTPRTVVDAMVSIVAPKLGQTVYDPCSGSCGFLVGAHAVIGPQANTVEEQELVSARTFNARLEGLHSKVGLLSHRSFGFHSAAPLIALIYLCCAGITINPPLQ